MNFKEFLYFSLFSSVTSEALNTIQISYGISYFRHRDSSDIFTYDIARQSVVDKMVREISLEVREKSGNLVFTFLWEPDRNLSVWISAMHISLSSRRASAGGKATQPRSSAGNPNGRSQPQIDIPHGGWNIRKCQSTGPSSNVIARTECSSGTISGVEQPGLHSEPLYRLQM